MLKTWVYGVERDPTTKTSSCVKDNRSFYYLKNKVS